jgi:hypothetical protein
MHERIVNISAEELGLERLLSRIIDGECTPDDSRALAELAQSDPTIWKRLAMRQHDMAVLAAKVNQTLQQADMIDLPIPQIQASANSTRATAHRASWWLAISGWAAMIMLVAGWSIWLANNDRAGVSERVMPAGGSTTNLSPDEHFQEYLKAPFVVSVLPPTLLEVQQEPDGRKLLHILRRIEEIVIMEADANVPVDDKGILTKPPSEMREPIPTRSQPNDT